MIACRTAGRFGRCQTPMAKGATLLSCSGPAPESAPCQFRGIRAPTLLRARLVSPPRSTSPMAPRYLTSSEGRKETVSALSGPRSRISVFGMHALLSTTRPIVYQQSHRRDGNVQGSTIWDGNSSTVIDIEIHSYGSQTVGLQQPPGAEESSSREAIDSFDERLTSCIVRSTVHVWQTQITCSDRSEDEPVTW